MTVSPAPDQRPAAAPAARRARGDATRALLLDAAVAVLISDGVARTTTLEVQKRAGVSRGALLHHFPTHAALLSATVARLVQMNEGAVQAEAAALAHVKDPLARGIRAVAAAFAHPSLAAELELWAVARTDAALRDALREAEKPARRESDRVMRALFSPLEGRRGLDQVIALTLEFARGLAVSSILRADAGRRDALIDGWIEAAGRLLDADAPG